MTKTSNASIDNNAVVGKDSNSSIELLKELLFEKDLEKSIESYFMEGDKFSLSHKSKITGCKIDYNAEQLMSLFAIESEIEVANILRMKFGNRVRHIGGTAIEDIAIEGTNYVFNVKASNMESVSTLKLFQSSSSLKLEGLRYRFILVNYRLTEDKKEIEFGKVNVFNYDYIKNAISDSKGSITILKTKVDEYTHMRDEYIQGNIQSFNMITKDRICKKPFLTIDQLRRYVMKLENLDVSSIQDHYMKKYNVSNLSTMFNVLIEEKLISFQDNKYVVNRVSDSAFNTSAVVINADNIKGLKYKTTLEMYAKYKSGELKMSNEKQLRDYLSGVHNISTKLSSTYIGKIKRLNEMVGG